MPEANRGVGYIADSNSDETAAGFAVVREVSDLGEYSALQEAAVALLALNDSLYLAALEKSYLRLKSMNSYYSNTFRIRGASSPFSVEQAGFWWGVELQNWLNSLYSYLAHYSKQIKAEFGDASDEFLNFETARRDAHQDNHGQEAVLGPVAVVLHDASAQVTQLRELGIIEPQK